MTTWQQLKDHFKVCGNVIYCTIFKVRPGSTPVPMRYSSVVGSATRTGMLLDSAP